MKKNILLLVLSSIIIIGCCPNEKKLNLDSKIGMGNTIGLNSSEYKLLLSPNNFSDNSEGFENYWNIIKEVAEEQNIPIIETENTMAQSHKNIGFFDTENMELRKNGYMLRRKIKFSNGVKKHGVEFSLKFRSVDPKIATTANVAVGEGYAPKYDKIELESDIVYYSVANGDLETTYSVQNVIELEENPKMTVGELAKIYPVLGELNIAPDEKLKLIAGTEPVEYMVRPGHLDFGDGLYGRMDMTVWIVELGGEKIKIPEFSFDHPFEKDKQYDSKAMDRCVTFINKLYEKNDNWVVPGKLKAVYLFEHVAQSN